MRPPNAAVCATACFGAVAAVLRCLRLRAKRREAEEDDDLALACAAAAAAAPPPSEAAGAVPRAGACVVLGSASALGSRYAARLVADGVRVCAVSRRLSERAPPGCPPELYEHRCCDLADPASCALLGEQLASGGEWRGASVVLFATTYTDSGDRALLAASLGLARTVGAGSFVFISSWVAGFEPRALDFSYRRAKRRAEREAARAAAHFPGGVDIVRISNVIGAPDLLHQRVLDRVGHCLPRHCSRAWVDVGEVVSALRQLPPGRGARLHSLYGSRRTVGELMAQKPPPALLLRPLCAAARGLSLVALAALAQVHTYFQGWVWRWAAPRSEVELLSFARPCNGEVLWLGRGAVIDFFRFDPGSRIAVSARRLRWVAAVEGRPDLIAASAGATYRDVLRASARSGRSLALVPNFTFVTVGASLATPLHGMNPGTATVGPMVDSVRVYDLALCTVREERRSPGKLLFRPGELVYLSAVLRTEADRGWVEHQRVLPAGRLDGDAVYGQISDALRQVGADLVELRCHVPAAGFRWREYRYSYLERGPPRGPPRNLLGRMWDWPPVKWLLCAGSSLMTNSEVFVDADHFAPFMRDFHACCLRPGSLLRLAGVCKLNVRLMRFDPEYPWALWGGESDKVAVDFGFCTLNPRTVGVIGELLRRHAQYVALHPAKYIHPSWKTDTSS
eukprot:TRINITY_DN17563_c0_g1_i1.p1 TRINITY_DN17563_c0_g1~~TRINITY_DN17563_c0_g1_i1.p1  ORF type:complete len:680 (+),score=190.03 TRINITY_DN17563_c0_g1_i1:84-2123(+)